MEKNQNTEKPIKKTTKSRAKPKEKVTHEAPPVLQAKIEETEKPQLSAEKIEDKITSVIIVAICFCFLAYVGYQTIMMNNNKSGSSPSPQPGRNNAPLTVVNYDCKKHSGDFTGCVNAQVSGKGCSWYASCKACIVGSHDGKTYEEICESKRR